MKLHLLCLELLLFLISCGNRVFKNELPQVLKVDKVEIEDGQNIDIYGGFGEGYTLEVYELSENTVQAFINNVSKALPNKKEDSIIWKKYDWTKSPFDSAYVEIAVMT